MTVSRKLLNKTNIVFLVFLILGFCMPSSPKTWSMYTYCLAAVLQLVFLARVFVFKNEEKARISGDVIFLAHLFLLAWELAVSKFNLLDRFLYPAPGEVVKLFIDDSPTLIKGFFSSMTILGTGYILAVLLGVSLGLVIGWNKRLYGVAKYITKMLGAVPPIIYIPYAIAILPTFRTASIFIVFIGSFWPIFINTLNGVFNIDRKLIDSARSINVSKTGMITHIILPGTIPSIMSGATIGLAFSFILLTSAEMIGATIGMGWYVKYFSDFANYPKVVVGIIFMGIVVSCITSFFEKLEKYLLRWR